MGFSVNHNQAIVRSSVKMGFSANHNQTMAR